MVEEKTLVRAHELLTEGLNAQLPARMATEAFLAEAEVVRSQAQEWTHGDGIEGLGVGEKISAGRPTGELALRVYVERKLPKRRLRSPSPVLCGTGRR